MVVGSVDGVRSDEVVSSVVAGLLGLCLENVVQALAAKSAYEH